jgi:hypothetical protein
MATFTITPATSQSGFVTMFDDDSAGADTLNILHGAYLINLIAGAEGIGASLANTGAWTVNIDGMLRGTTDIGWGIGLELAGNNPGASRITVGTSGSVYGSLAAISLGGGFSLQESSVTIRNAGLLESVGTGILSYASPGTLISIFNSGKIGGGYSVDHGLLTSAEYAITNTGSMAAMRLRGSNSTLTNSGTIGENGSGSAFLAMDGNNTITNLTDGQIGGLINLGGGTNRLTNSGFIFKNGDDVSFSAGNGLTAVINSGNLTGAVYAGDGTNTLTNSGDIGGDTDDWSYKGGTGSDTINNSAAGWLQGAIFAGDGTNRLVNAGTVFPSLQGPSDGVSYVGGTGNDTISNSGRLDGSVVAYGGTNSLTNSGGIGKDNNDGWSYEGGDGTDTVSVTAFSATLMGGVNMGDGTNRLANAGIVGAVSNVSYRGGIGIDSGIDTVTNSGALLGAVVAGDGNSNVSNIRIVGATTFISLANTGTIGESGLYSYSGDNGADTVTNTSTIVSALARLDGAVQLFDGTNRLTNIGGEIGANGDNFAVVAGSGNDTVLNSNVGLLLGRLMGGVNLGSGNNSLTNSGLVGASTVLKYSYMGGAGKDTIVNSGAMIGFVLAGTGIETTPGGSAGNSLINSGSIGADTNGVSYRGGAFGDTVTNSGTITGTVEMVGSDLAVAVIDGNRLVNTRTGTVGALNTTAVFGGNGRDSVENAGFIMGGIGLGDGSNSLVNRLIVGTNGGGSSYSGGDGADSVVNHAGALVQGSISLWSGANVLTNNGSIVGEVEGGAAVDTISNTGTMLAGLELFGGNDIVTNRGTLGNTVNNPFIFSTGDDNDQVQNSGRIIGDVDLGSGADVFTNFIKTGKVTKHGVVTSEIDLGGDDDIFNGGNNAETVLDGAGQDTVFLGGGNDTFRWVAFMVGDLEETIDGGTGVDTYDASAATAQVFVNIGAADFNGNVGLSAGMDFFDHLVEAQSADGNTMVKDIVRRFENIIGGDNGGVLYGSEGANDIRGGTADDYIFGFGGDDTIRGGNGGIDRMVGGAGRDTLYGGGTTGTDIFYFLQKSDSTVIARDVIMDFDSNDLIELRRIDADENTPKATIDDNGEAFTLLGTQMFADVAIQFTAAAQLRVKQIAGGWLIEGETNGDAIADFAIEVRDHDHSLTWSANNLDDFVF